MPGSSKILVVDDQDSVREAVVNMLDGQGYDLAVATNGAEALRRAAEIIPDLILLDVMMPEMDGFETCRRLRGDPRLAEVPVIMITALDDSDSRLRGFEAGADDFVSKPCDQVELQARVRTITQLNRYRRLHTERAKFEWVVEKADDGYLVVGDDDKILYANPQARIYLGFADGGDRPLAETFVKTAARYYRCEPQGAWVTWPEPPPTDTPLYLVRPESETANPLWLQVERFSMPPGAAERHLLRLRDVTSAVTAQRYMWSFHNQVSHKLKTPLTLIVSSLDLLQEEGAELAEEDHKTLLATAHQGAMRLLAQIQDIFRYLETPLASRKGSGRCTVADIPSIVADIKTRLELESVKVVPVASAQAPFPKMDARHLYLPLSRHGMDMVLEELLVNARKFHPERSPNVEIRISGRTEGIRIEVCDDGQTLSPEELSRMWMPYYQVEKHFTGQMAGMGLGLPMVASLLWDVGGTCRSYGRQDRPGVVVELTLPPFVAES
jgi:two-component system cell cycle response regulator